MEYPPRDDDESAAEMRHGARVWRGEAEDTETQSLTKEYMDVQRQLELLKADREKGADVAASATMQQEGNVAKDKIRELAAKLGRENQEKIQALEEKKAALEEQMNTRGIDPTGLRLQ